MVKDRFEQLQRLQQEHPLQLMRIVINEVYPNLFDYMNSIMANIRLMPKDNSTMELAMLADKAGNEMDILFRKEKLVLFPFITALIDDNKKSDTCKPFKTVKTHYSSMLSVIQEMKLLIARMQEQQQVPVHINEQLNDFEKLHIMLQITKDKFLFAPFKSCKSCNAFSK